MVERLNFARYWAVVLLLALCAFAPAGQRHESGEERLGDERPQLRGEGPPARPADLGEYSGRGQRGFSGGFPPPYRAYEPPSEASSKQGYVFVEGEYLSPPYEIRFADNVLTVNGRALECKPPHRSYGGRGFGSRAGEASWRFMLGEVLSQLSSDLVVLSFKDQPYVVLDSNTTYDLLKAMTTEGGRAIRQVSIREQLPEDFDKTVWDAWIDGFEPPGELLQRAAVLVNLYEDSQREAQADMRATRLMNQLAYPLAIGGMVLTVLAVGHLLGGRPHARQRVIGLDESPEMIHSLNWSLLFVAAFSLLDLTWTILAANAGQMQELNPLGSHLIENPRHLAGFKVGITMPSLALLWLLRKHKRAQVAAWWLCLILTFVTLRWLTMSPLMAPT